MKIFLNVLCLACLLLISCGDDKNETEDIDAAKKAQQQQPLITEDAIEKFDYTDYALSSESEERLENWKKYQELAIQISYLKKADLSFFNSEKEPLKKFLDEFNKSVPKTLRTNQILSRIAILETNMLKLNENLNLDNIEDRLKLMGVKDVLEAFSNLNYQINKKLERDFYDKIKPE
ncbi:hypothetical protein [Winogradskyella sp. SYSU M77433]|uniref:hypothetical protein n=1 Tax=Winogradskyella sp. SYSU M77433 TaxID=3042722 RepID=UPI002480BC95|nr:hypothetical protein [Winogradskyella sp. SYSU M77433]MDH7913585.1 hypothetical protein [Winogradskyella sp. SYSU M77433]